ncbi:MAG: PEP-CTERM sorting domain-containing protein [Planctomycetales bacterium]|nr:PEP-CTERM sorting domain-containing protein [Planctomycetales bacterium]
MHRVILPSGILNLIFCITPVIFAAEYGANSSGDWSDSGIWTPLGGPPVSGDSAYIGSYTPGGSATSATVTLDANQQVTNLYLGNGNSTSGTLDLSNYTLSVDNALVIGSSGGIGSILRGSGYLIADNLTVQGGNSFALNSSDSVNQRVNVNGSSSQLGLGAPLTLTQDLELANGATLDANGQAISVRDLHVGYLYGPGPVSLLNDGAITAVSFIASGSTTTLTSGDDVITDTLTLQSDAKLTIQQSPGGTEGLTFLGNSLNILDTSVLELAYDAVPGSNYLDHAFRWENDQSSANRVDVITGLINSGKMVINLPTDIRVFGYSDGFTYVTVGAEYPADFDEDTDVDGDDLVNWESGFGMSGSATHADGDADQDMDTDGFDFLVWQLQFGLQASSITASASPFSVPEPSTLLLLVAAVFGLQLRGFRAIEL